MPDPLDKLKAAKTAPEAIHHAANVVARRRGGRYVNTHVTGDTLSVLHNAGWELVRRAPAPVRVPEDGAEGAREWTVQRSVVSGLALRILDGPPLAALDVVKVREVRVPVEARVEPEWMERRSGEPCVDCGAGVDTLGFCECKGNDHRVDAFSAPPAPVSEEPEVAARRREFNTPTDDDGWAQYDDPASEPKAEEDKRDA